MFSRFKHRFTLLRSLVYVQKILNFVKKLGKEIIWHGKNKSDQAIYCVNCEVIFLNLSPNECFF